MPSILPPPAGASLSAPPLPWSDDDSRAHWSLFLDVDGCLLDFADDPDAVVVTSALGDALRRLHDLLDGALALVSGRSVDDLLRLFGAPPWTLAGLHGFELRREDGRCRELMLDPAHEARMRQEVRLLAAQLQDVQIEDKGHAIALHCRRAPQQLPALRKAATTLVERLPGYELQDGNLVVEFKPAGVDKGQVVAELLRQKPFAGRRPVYLGDDLTDEHAFATINAAGGISVRVGEREPSQAYFTLSTPGAVHAWLCRVVDALSDGVIEHADHVGEPPVSQS
jgi:trehalose 6-phosphate phosphatase